jgi:hypothetical protein
MNRRRALKAVEQVQRFGLLAAPAFLLGTLIHSLSSKAST